MCLGSVCSFSLMSGACVFMTLFGCFCDRCECTICVCIVLMFCLICSSVGFVVVSEMFIV